MTTTGGRCFGRCLSQSMMHLDYCVEQILAAITVEGIGRGAMMRWCLLFPSPSNGIQCSSVLYFFLCVVVVYVVARTIESSLES